MPQLTIQFTLINFNISIFFWKIVNTSVLLFSAKLLFISRGSYVRFALVTSVYACSIFVFRRSWPMTCKRYDAERVHRSFQYSTPQYDKCLAVSAIAAFYVSQVKLFYLFIRMQLAQKCSTVAQGVLVNCMEVTAFEKRARGRRQLWRGPRVRDI